MFCFSLLLRRFILHTAGCGFQEPVCLLSFREGHSGALLSSVHHRPKLHMSKVGKPFSTYLTPERFSANFYKTP